MSNFFKKNKKTILILLIAIIFIMLGIKRGDFNGVYKKASMICFECIGIG